MSVNSSFFSVWGSQEKFTCGRFSGLIKSLLFTDRYGRTDSLLVDDLKSVPVLIDLGEVGVMSRFLNSPTTQA